MMNIKILSVLTILSVFAASNVMAGDFKRNHHADDKHQHAHVVVKNKHKNKRVITTHYHSNHFKKKVVSKKIVSKKSAQHKNSRSGNYHNKNDRLGLLVGGIVIGSVLSGR